VQVNHVRRRGAGDKEKTEEDQDSWEAHREK